jgi:hypothetical protein
VQRARNRHEVGITEQHECGAVHDAKVNRAERVLDGTCVLVRPSENAGTEVAQSTLFVLGLTVMWRFLSYLWGNRFFDVVHGP